MKKRDPGLPLETRKRPGRIFLLRAVCLLLVTSVPAIILGAVWYLQSTRIEGGGEFALSSLAGVVKIEEDSLGVPTLFADNAVDLIRAQGWIMARDRFFQMDLIRRRSAGKLAAIFGPAALESDRLRRSYGFSQLAANAMDQITPKSRSTLEAFAEGVNDFLKSGPLPLELRLIGYQPEPWTASDCMLVALSMFDPPYSERAFNLASTLLPEKALRFFTPPFGFLDAPILPDPSTPPLPEIPPAEVFQIRQTRSGMIPGVSVESEPSPGSNAWAIAGKKTKSGKAILSGDPHLSLSLPNIWYRLKLKGPNMDVTGTTIPGIPGILIGSNGRVAWTFTNAMADHADRVLLPEDYSFEEREETIEVKGQPADVHHVRVTQWGPVITGTGAETGQRYALQWVALSPENYSGKALEMTELNASQNLEAALNALKSWSGPVHNAILADSEGQIGWTVVGNIPNRVGFDGSVSIPRDAQHYWDGFIPFEKLPKVVDPKEGFIVSANQRTVPFNQHPERYSTEVISSARAYRIRKLLSKRDDWDAISSYEIQLDIVSEPHLRYRDLLLTALPTRQAASDSADQQWLQAISKLIQDWDGKMGTESPAYPFLRTFRNKLFLVFLEKTLSEIPDEKDREIVLERLSRDAWIMALFEKRPEHFLDSQYSSYDELLRSIAIQSARELADTPMALSSLKWGNINRTKISHPLSLVLPGFLARFVNLPESPLPGDQESPREGRPSHGASLRMVVDLANPEKSIFNMPGGQSGHLFSKHYSDQFKSWLDGTPTPFEPGFAVTTTLLKPNT